ncbi:MAG: redoxin domain-containing protein [Cyclobacteriaceae bacterium]
MKRKWVKKLLGFLLLAIVVLLMYATYNKLLLKHEIKQNLETLSFDHIYDLDGRPFRFPELANKIPCIIIFFNSTCDFCQNEAIDINANLERLMQIQIVMVSTESVEEIEAFRDKYKLLSENVHFARIKNDHVIPAFGSTSVPLILVYDASGKLLESFNGRTSVSAILKVFD